MICIEGVTENIGFHLYTIYTRFLLVHYSFSYKSEDSPTLDQWFETTQASHHSKMFQRYRLLTPITVLMEVMIKNSIMLSILK